MQLTLSFITGVIKALKNNGIHFTIVDNAEVNDGGHGMLFLRRVLARLTRYWHADRVEQTRLTAHVGNVSAKTGHVAKIG